MGMGPKAKAGAQAVLKPMDLPGPPVWFKPLEINGKLDSGVKPLKTLARLSGFKGDTDF